MANIRCSWVYLEVQFQELHFKWSGTGLVYAPGNMNLEPNRGSGHGGASLFSVFTCVAFSVTVVIAFSM